MLRTTQRDIVGALATAALVLLVGCSAFNTRPAAPLAETDTRDEQHAQAPGIDELAERLQLDLEDNSFW